MDLQRNDYFSVSVNTELNQRKYFHTSVEWKIICFKGRALEQSCRFTSPVFQCSNASWKLDLYPKGEPCNSAPVLCVTRINSGLEINLNTYFQFSIFDEGEKKLCTYTSKEGTLYGRDKTVSVNLTGIGVHKELLCSQNSLAISFSICVEDGTVPTGLNEITRIFKDGRKKSLRLSRTSNSLFSDFEDLYKDPQFSDVTLKLGEKEFQAHKLVLRSRSSVFAAMFKHDMKENQQDTVDLVEMEEDTVRDMLRFMYCGKVDELSLEHALNLYVAADRYDLKELKVICREFILCDISINNVCDIAIVADLHNDESLVNEVKSFLIKNGSEIIKTEKWQALSVSNSVLCAKMFEWAFSKE